MEDQNIIKMYISSLPYFIIDMIFHKNIQQFPIAQKSISLHYASITNNFTGIKNSRGRHTIKESREPLCILHITIYEFKFIYWRNCICINLSLSIKESHSLVSNASTKISSNDHKGQAEDIIEVRQIGEVRRGRGNLWLLSKRPRCRQSGKLACPAAGLGAAHQE